MGKVIQLDERIRTRKEAVDLIRVLKWAFCTRQAEIEFKKRYGYSRLSLPLILFDETTNFSQGETSVVPGKLSWKTVHFSPKRPS